MGVLRSKKRVEKIGEIHRWRSYFWVCNTDSNTIQYFKNDQAPRPKGVIAARDIADVHATADKHHKFFSLIIKIRGGVQRELKMASRDLRDKWLAAVLRIMRSVRSQDRVHAMTSVVRERVRGCAAQFNFDVEANFDGLKDLQPELFSAYLEGLEAGVSVVRDVLASTAGPRPIERLYVNVIVTPVNAAQTARHADVAAQTAYDPASKSLRLAVTSAPDATGNYTSRTLDVAALKSMLGSTMWRNPQFEGWLTLDRSAQAERERISKLLGVDKFEVTLQWGHDLDADRDADAVRRYMSRFVNARLLLDIYHCVQSLTAADDVATAQGNSVARVGVVSAGECLRRFVTGVGVHIGANDVSAQQPPRLTVSHRMWRDEFLGPAFALTARFRDQVASLDAKPATASKAFDPLRNLEEQLNDVVVHVRVADSCRRFERSVTDALQRVEKPDSVAVAWESFAEAVAKLRLPQFSERKLANVLDQTGEACASRYRAFAAQAGATGQSGLVQRCIRTFKLDFVAVSVQSSSVDWQLAARPPRVAYFDFTETMVFMAASSSGAAVSHESCFDLPFSPLPQLPGLHVNFAVGALHTWFRGYFASPANAVPFPEAADGDDGDDDEDGGGSAASTDESDGDEAGNLAGKERTLEAQVLTEDDAAAMIYDRQGSNVELKAGAETISEGIKRLTAAFPAQRISKHDILRIFVLTLRRLQQLFVPLAAAEGTTTTALGTSGQLGKLTPEAARHLLSEYCEYQATEAYIDDAVRGLTEFDFHEIAAIVMLRLMPSEAVLAMQSRRSILVSGLENTGKTLVINSLRREVRRTFPSIGVTQTVVPFRSWCVHFKELGGRSWEQGTAWRHYIPRAGELQGVVFVVDSARPERLGESQQYMTELLDMPLVEGLPVLLLANGIGTETALSLEEVTARLTFDELCAGRPHAAAGCHVTMATHRPRVDEGLDQGLSWLLKAVDDQCGEVPPLPKCEVSAPSRDASVAAPAAAAVSPPSGAAAAPPPPPPPPAAVPKS